MKARDNLARVGSMMALLALSSCGGGGGGGGSEPAPPPPPTAASCTNRPNEFVGVCTGFPDTGNLDWNAGGDGSGGAGDGGGASGDGGVGAGGDFGQFRNVNISVFNDSGALLGTAPTDGVKGMVTIRPGASYRGSLRLELRGGPGAQYFEEGTNRFVDFPADRVIRVIVPRVDKNIGITAFTEAAYQLLTQGSTPESVGTGVNPTPAQIAAANARVAALLNEHVPKALEVPDITRLPFIKSNAVLPGTITPTARGVYGVVNGAFSKQAALFNTGSSTPTLDALAQLAEDLRDGVLDGRNGNAPSAPANKRTYDPQTLTSELTSALAHQAERFGNTAVQDTLPPVLNYGGTRYEGYLFDSSVPRGRRAVSTVAGWLAGNNLNLTVGQALPKALPNGQAVFSMISNMGHGGAFFKIDNTDTTTDPVYRVYALGDNVNGELGTGNQTSTNRALVEVTLPGPLTHAAGGFAHTVLRLADGRVLTLGDNTFGQLGQGVDGNTLARSSTPLPVNLPSAAGGAVAVAATSVASYALMADGSVYTWGSNGGFALLGNGQANGMATTPVLVSGLSDVVQISARDNDVVVLKRDQSIWQWGAHPADVNAYTDSDVSGAYRGGSRVPTAVAGLPTRTVGGRTEPIPVRKIITEQGVFAALLSNGHVYSWGVHFDLTAKSVLRDLTAARVLGLPPVRDMMPGGFVGYGSRPFDRLTAMGVDYRGGMWKIRGRVAERFDPANPTAQRRTQSGLAITQACSTCHTFLDQPLETLRERQLAEAPVPANAAVCAPPTSFHVAPNGSSFIRAETECIQCHNPARLDPAYAGLLRPAFVSSGGWPNCNKPTNLPPRTSITSTPIATVCSIPVGHPFTPPGTVCSSCHNSVAARALQDLNPPCVQPGAGALPTLPTVATISAVLDDLGAPVGQGAYTNDSTPALQGTLGSALSGAQTLAVSRNGSVVGNAVVSGTSWSYTDSSAPQGTLVYTARVVQGAGFGPTSNTYTVRVDSVAPTVTAQITSLSDDNLGVIANGGYATDSTPTVSGTLSAAPGTGELLQVLRNGAVVGTATVTANNWSYTEPAALVSNTYSYQVRLVDPANNLGPVSSARSFILIGGVAGASITSVVDDANASIAAGSVTRDATPSLAGTITAALPSGTLVRVLRNGASAGVATASGTSWTFTDGAPQGAVSYTVRVEAGAVIGNASAAYAFSVDSIAPTQTVVVAQISDDYIGALAAGASTADQTPTISGTLSAALAAGEQLRLRRTLVSSGAFVDQALTPTGTNWTFTESSLLAAGSYTYQAQVFDPAGNTGSFSATLAVTVNLSALPLPGAAVTLATVNGVVPSGGSVPLNSINTPALAGTVARALNSGEVVRVYRNGTGVANATVATTSGVTTWTYTNTLLADGNYSFYARVELSGNSGVFGASSSTVGASIDATAPTQTATLVSISDNSGALVNVTDTFSTDTTPRLDGTLNIALGTGDFIRIIRDGAVVATVRPTGTTWSYVDSAVSLGTHTYTVDIRDDAGNIGTVAARPTRSVTLILASSLPSATITSAAVSGTGSPGKPNTTVVASGQAIPDATPTLTIALSAPLPTGYLVQVLEAGSPIGSPFSCSSPCTFTTPSVADGSRVFSARSTAGPVLAATGNSYTLVIDTVAPTQTVSITEVLSDRSPWGTVPGATPPDGLIANNGQTNSSRPQFQVVTSAARAAGETFQVRRGGSVLLVTSGVPGSCAVSNCSEFNADTGVTMIGTGSGTPNPNILPALSPTVSFQTMGTAVFTVRVVDSAGWEGPATANYTINVGYFLCDQLRANATYRSANPGFNHSVISAAANPSNRCIGCHAVGNGHPASPTGTAAGHFVAVPSNFPSYWCRRPG